MTVVAKIESGRATQPGVVDGTPQVKKEGPPEGAFGLLFRDGNDPNRFLAVIARGELKIHKVTGGLVDANGWKSESRRRAEDSYRWSFLEPAAAKLINPRRFDISNRGDHDGIYVYDQIGAAWITLQGEGKTVHATADRRPKVGSAGEVEILFPDVLRRSDLVDSDFSFSESFMRLGPKATQFLHDYLLRDDPQYYQRPINGTEVPDLSESGDLATFRRNYHI